MAIYTGSPFLGPVLGPVIAGFINQVRIRLSRIQMWSDSISEISAERELAMDVPYLHHLDVLHTVLPRIRESIP